MRRGQAEMLEWFPRLILMTVAVVIIVVLVRVYTDRDPTSPDLNRAAYLYRIYYGDVINYQDKASGRIYPGIIDANKLTTQHLDEVFAERGMNSFGQISSMILFTPNGQCAIAADTVYNDKETYQSQAQAFGKAGTQGIGSGTVETMMYPVTLKKDSAQCSGILNITIVRPNS